MTQISWNAGVIMMHRSQAKYLKDVFALTDSFYQGTKHHGCEQYAFCLVLDMYGQVRDCEEMVYHYWLPVKKLIADKFIAPRITDEWSKQSADRKIRDITKWVAKFPRFIRCDILMIRSNAMQAFYKKHLLKGYLYALAAFIKSPLDKKFLKDVMYHTKRLINERRH
jgi:hypothetical protein